MEMSEDVVNPSSRKRGRKRKERIPIDPKVGEIGMGKDLVSRYVWKNFPGTGIFLGKVVKHNRGFYRVKYEDGDSEDLEYGEIRDIIIPGDDSDAQLSLRKHNLEQLLLSNNKKKSKKSGGKQKQPIPSPSITSNLEFNGGSAINDVDGEKTIDSSIDSCESDSAAESPPPPPPLCPLPLPPSSANLGLPEDSVSFLFCVYTFLRSFSRLLFLSPFTLHDFLGSLNCVSQNNLLDSVHVSLLRALRRHLEMILSSDGVNLASRCLRRLDWNLLDTLTWPVFVVEYLVMMGYTKGQNWEGFCNHVLYGDYYTLPINWKLRVLQILCDDILDSAELRTEIDMREKLEEETEVDGATLDLLPESGPKRVHPRSSKTSACRDAEAMENTVDSNQQGSIEVKVAEPEADLNDLSDDGNSDECRLCGMDGTLICCDGCPSAYHSRCVGLSKALLPDGLWFCPECLVNKAGPTCSRIGMGLRGADVFGVDMHGRSFLGTCNYLLVLDSSLGAESVSKYYSQDDVTNVLCLLSSSEQYESLYCEICKGISQHWGILEDTKFSHHERSKICINSLDGKDDARDSSSGNQALASISVVERGNQSSHTSESNVDNGEKVCLENGFHEVVASVSLNSVRQCNRLDSKTEDFNDHTAKQVSLVVDTKLHEQLMTEPIVSDGSLVTLLDSSDLNNQSSVERSAVLEVSGREDANAGGPKGHSSGGSAQMGASFKPQAYVNQYILGDVAASAAANLAILTPENGRITETDVSSQPKKVTSEDVSLQLKAFAGAAVHFIWPSSQRKLIEVPRERCGWCLACKAPPNRKMGCLLNYAASKALKGVARVPAGLKPVRNVEHPISTIVTYILHMEESLRGLIVGPFLIENYRRQWRKKVELALTCGSLKYLLLELEKNIHVLALSGGWLKVVDDWSAEISSVQNGISNVGPPQKRGPSGRRNKKQLATPEDTLDPCFDWWRGGKLSKMLFQKGMLPASIVKIAARQGGFKKIYSISYNEEVPRRSRRFAWRAAVEMSRNTSQLAVQVRYLDEHIRWSDLTRPEQLFEGKGSDENTSVFRNAVICEKKLVERKTMYAVVFSNQRYLSSRVMKNIAEVEPIENGKERLWFAETHIPLYLIKEYEEKADTALLPSFKKEPHCLSTFQFKLLKACQQEDIFSYLVNKRDRPERWSCASCQRDNIIRNAVKCSTCQGNCHQNCISWATGCMKADLVFKCNKCYNTESTAIGESSLKRLKVKMSLPGSGQIVSVTSGLPGGEYEIAAQSIGTKRNRLEMLSPIANPKLTPKSKGSVNQTYGLVWMRKNPRKPDGGLKFRHQNILLKGADLHPPVRPTCTLCHQPYNPDLMYICCESCSNWLHADAVQLKEDSISNLEGFRCGKCRRKASPACPYMDPKPDSNKLLMRISRKTGNKEERHEGGTKSHVFETIYRDGEAAKMASSLLQQERTENKTTIHVAGGGSSVTSLLQQERLLQQKRTENKTTIHVAGGGGSVTPLLQQEKLLQQERTENKTTIHVAGGGGGGSVTPLLQQERLLQQKRTENKTTIQVAGGGGSVTPLLPQERTENTTTINAAGGGGSVTPPLHPKVDVLKEVGPLALRENPAQPITETNAAGPLHEMSQKLAVRRHVKHDDNLDLSGDMTQADVATPDKPLSPVAEWDLVNSGKFIKYEGGNSEEMEFEPQTYFSFTELLASDDENQLGDLLTSEDNDQLGDLLESGENLLADLMGSEDDNQLEDFFDFSLPENWDNSAADCDGTGAVCQAMSPNSCKESDMSAGNSCPEVNSFPCKMCGCREPSPNLLCVACQMQIHTHCSPWVEQPPSDSRWKCGYCRDWR